MNHGWRTLRARILARPAGSAERLAGAALTFVAVVLAWVFFRASDFDTAWRLIDAMRGDAALQIPANWPLAWQLTAALKAVGLSATQGVPITAFDPSGHAPFWIAGLLAIVWLAPNSQQIMARFEPALERAQAAKLAWRPTRQTAICAGCAVGFALLHLNRVSEFLYFQF